MTSDQHPSAFPLTQGGIRGWATREQYATSESWIGRDARYMAETAMTRVWAERGALIGWCRVCERYVDFLFARPDYDGPPIWREQLACTGCGFIMRHRLGLDLLLQVVMTMDRPPRVFLTEHASPRFVWASQRWPDVIGSEFAPDASTRLRLGRYLAGLQGIAAAEIRHEDCTALNLTDASQDSVITFDVLEHVPDYRAALREFSRVLAPGGWLILSVPFDYGADETVTRARLRDDGVIEHLLPPEYHGDPTSDNGCLAFYAFGWSLLDDMRAAGFREAWAVDAWSPVWGWLGASGLIVAQR